MYNEAVLDEIMTYAQAVSPDKKIFSTDWGTSVAHALEMRRWAFERNLAFVPWSFQLEEKYIPLQFNGNATAELQVILKCTYILDICEKMYFKLILLLVLLWLSSSIRYFP